MTVFKYNYKRLLASAFALAIISCSSPWDEREIGSDANLSVTLNQAISATDEVSEFNELLKKTGYDKILADSKTYTVFAPTNAAMADVDETILSDTESLKQFVANHIALTSYTSVRTEDVRVKMLSNKYLDFEGSSLIDEATIVKADMYASNGVYHIINKALTPKLNVWEYINSQKENSKMAEFLVSLTDFSIYASDADAKLEAVVGDSLSNSYLKNVYNLNNEKNNYTFFLMKDEGYDTEVTKMKPYLIKPSNDPAIDSTAIYASYFTTRDLAFPKKYKRADLPDQLTSRFGVEFDVNKTQIVDEIQLSNGVVYVMGQVDVALDKRLLTKRIEGENISGYFNGARTAIYYRTKIDPLDPDLLLNDVLVQNPGVASFILNYRGREFYSTKYEVYWRAVNDFQATAISQSLQLSGDITVVNNSSSFIDIITRFNNISVPVGEASYKEVLIGTFELTKARDIDYISLIAANSTANGANSLSLDYLRFEPQLK